jgi:hypothetical protein
MTDETQTRAVEALLAVRGGLLCHQPSLAKRVRAAAPEPPWAKAGTAASYGSASHAAIVIGKHSRKADAVLAPDQNIENNPMQSSVVSLAWML